MRAVLILFLVALVACATPSAKLIEIRLGMTQDEVRTTLGDPTVARGSLRNKYGQEIYVWEYALTQPSSDTAGDIIWKSVLTVMTLGFAGSVFASIKRNYWLYFLDRELVQWGQAGDWKREADRIYEFRFEPRTGVPQR